MKGYLLIIMLLLSGLTLEAQQFYGGLTGGLTASQVDGDNTKGYHKPGFTIGAWVQTDLSPVVYAGMEIKYAQKGSRKKPDERDPVKEKYIMRLGYMDIPVYIGFRTSEQISLFLGLSAGYLVHSAEYGNYGLFPKEDRHEFNEFDYQAFIGGRFDLTNRLSLDLRLAYSFLPVRELETDILWYWWDDQYNNVISTCLAYRFGK
ncbi:porin family protein [Gaoshiqia sp. Z1-71]|uniref:porin family protein n=1 Tax=Gaoshiqia hydrogeniformans TaxID=3290090 RepID=UPI003BF7C74A